MTLKKDGALNSHYTGKKEGIRISDGLVGVLV